MRLKLFISLLLFAGTLALYWPARHFDIVYYDDPLFVTDNPEVASGLHWHSFVWAMTSVTAANWHPVTSLSFVLTHQFFGTNPGAEHLVNVVVHAANAVLLFLVLLQLTGAPWRGAVTAAIFAWHPLRVESVCWIAERKDVLFAFFYLLSLLCYVQSVAGGQRRRGETERGGAAYRSPFYWLALLFFALGFMSKAMIVTLPFLLVLLDYWPLERFKVADLRITILALFREKIPFFALTAVFCALTFWIQQTHAAVVSLSKLGIGYRLSDATLSYGAYLGKLIWPADLAIIYPYPQSLPWAGVTAAGLLLLCVTVLAVANLRRRPYLAVGWFWYLGTLLPVSGLVQVGETAMADRYTYFPLVGVVLAVVWLAADWAEYVLKRKFLLTAAAAGVLVACLAVSARQIQYWRSTIDLFGHAVAVTGPNPGAQFCLANGFEQAGDLRRAAVHFRIEAALAPRDDRARYNLGGCLAKMGRYADALTEYEAVLGDGYKQDDPDAHVNVASALAHVGRYAAAEGQLEQALELNPASADAMNNLAWLLATCPDGRIRDGDRAVALGEKACAATGDDKAIYIGTLAAAYAEAGRFDDAISAARRAVVVAGRHGEKNLAARNGELLGLYQEHRPYREVELVPASK